MSRFLLIAALAAAPGHARAAELGQTAGLVQVRPSGSDRWGPAGRAARALSGGDALRTGFNAKAVVSLSGGASAEAGANTQLALEEDGRGGSVVDLLFGSARVTARGLGGRRLEVRAPTAVARARSDDASWRVVVGGGGNVLVEVAAGLVAVEDVRGSSLRLRAGERVEADLAGLHSPTTVPTPARARHEAFADRMRRELSYDREAGADQRLVASELRREEYELGRVQTDASGSRVRVESFLVRTSASGFSFVTLNSRRGSGLSYYSWAGSFDRALPTDLSTVIASLPGTLDAAAPWTLTGFVETRSNGPDTLTVTASGGHQVDLNHNADATDDVSVLYDPSRDDFAVVAAGRAVFKTLFDSYALSADGVVKSRLTGTNIQSQSDAVADGTLPVHTSNSTFPDSGAAYRLDLDSYSDGTEIRTEERAVSRGGGVVSRAAFGPATSGPAWQADLLRSAFEQTATASEFSGRSIRLMLSPRFPIANGSLR